MIDTSPVRHWFMHTSHLTVGLTMASKRVVSQPPPASPRETRLLRVGLVAGPEATWDLAAARLAEHLCTDRCLEVHHAWDCVDLGIDDPTDYDCIVLLGWPAASSRERIKRIELYCRGGGSLVALRAMHAEIPGWSNFTEEVFGGRQLDCRECRLLEVERSQSAWHHPVVKDVESMIAEGDVYDGPRFSPDTTVLLTANVRQRDLPVAWAARHEGGRVVCTTLGQDDDFREPSFLRLIRSAVRWAGLVHGR